MAYLLFNEIPHKGVTKKYIVNNTYNEYLGIIKWKSGWRKYIFETKDCIYDVKCLNEIIEFINKLTNERADRK